MAGAAERRSVRRMPPQGHRTALPGRLLELQGGRRVPLRLLRTAPVRRAGQVRLRNRLAELHPAGRRAMPGGADRLQPRHGPHRGPVRALRRAPGPCLPGRPDARRPAVPPATPGSPPSRSAAPDRSCAPARRRCAPPPGPDPGRDTPRTRPGSPRPAPGPAPPRRPGRRSLPARSRSRSRCTAPAPRSRTPRHARRARGTARTAPPPHRGGSAGAPTRAGPPLPGNTDGRPGPACS